MDATWKESALNQIEGNPVIPIDFADDLIIIIAAMPERRVRDIANSQGDGRFFYNADAGELKDKISQAITQRDINALRRRGITFESEEINELFPATYRRGGHYYVNGVRQY